MGSSTSKTRIWEEENEDEVAAETIGDERDLGRVVLMCFPLIPEELRGLMMRAFARTCTFSGSEEERLYEGILCALRSGSVDDRHELLFEIYSEDSLTVSMDTVYKMSGVCEADKEQTTGDMTADEFLIWAKQRIDSPVVCWIHHIGKYCGVDGHLSRRHVDVCDSLLPVETRWKRYREEIGKSTWLSRDVILNLQDVFFTLRDSMLEVVCKGAFAYSLPGMEGGLLDRVFGAMELDGVVPFHFFVGFLSKCFSPDPKVRIELCFSIFGKDGFMSRRNIETMHSFTNITYPNQLPPPSYPEAGVSLTEVLDPSYIAFSESSYNLDKIFRTFVTRIGQVMRIEWKIPFGTFASKGFKDRISNVLVPNPYSQCYYLPCYLKEIDEDVGDIVGTEGKLFLLRNDYFLHNPLQEVVQQRSQQESVDDSLPAMPATHDVEMEVCDEAVEEDPPTPIVTSGLLKTEGRPLACLIHHTTMCDDNVEIELETGEVLTVPASSLHVPSPPSGKVGLGNIGNTCYMNSALQCLAHIPLIREYFLSRRFLHDINLQSASYDGMNGRLAMSFYDLLVSLWSHGSSSYSPFRFKKLVGEFRAQFSSMHQQDAQEFLGFMLQGLSDDLNRVMKKPFVAVRDALEEREDDDVADERWAVPWRRDDSIITALFSGQEKVSIKCLECGTMNRDFPVFGHVILPLSNKSHAMRVKVVWQHQPALRIQVKIPLEPPPKVADLITAVADLLGLSREGLQIGQMHPIPSILSLVSPPETLDLQANYIAFASMEPKAGSVMVTVVHRSIQLPMDRHVPPPSRLFNFAHVLMLPSQATLEEIMNHCWDMVRWMVSDYGSDTDGKPFVLSKVDEEGRGCGVCPWYKGCHGCMGTAKKMNDPVDLRRGDVIAVDWPLSLLQNEELKSGYIKSVENHPSTAADMSDPLTLLSSLHDNNSPSIDAHPSHCGVCKGETKKERTTKLWRAPPVLMFQVKRFKDLYDKLQNPVTFPVDSLELKEFMAEASPAPLRAKLEKKLAGVDPRDLFFEPEEQIVKFLVQKGFSAEEASSICKDVTRLQNCSKTPLPPQEHSQLAVRDPPPYTLHSVVSHQGTTLQYGHYFAHVRNPRENAWYRYDDQLVARVGSIDEDIVPSHTYLLFYIRKDIEEAVVGDIFKSPADRPRVDPMAITGVDLTPMKTGKVMARFVEEVARGREFFPLKMRVQVSLSVGGDMLMHEEECSLNLRVDNCEWMCDGIHRALLDACKGDIFMLTVHPDYGFKEEGRPRLGVPPNATLHYKVFVMDVAEWAAEEVNFRCTKPSVEHTNVREGDVVDMTYKLHHCDGTLVNCDRMQVVIGETSVHFEPLHDILCSLAGCSEEIEILFNSVTASKLLPDCKTPLLYLITVHSIDKKPFPPPPADIYATAKQLLTDITSIHNYTRLSRASFARKLNILTSLLPGLYGDQVVVETILRHLSQSNPERCIPCATEALEHCEVQAPLYLVLARCFQSLNNLKDCEKNLDTVLMLDQHCESVDRSEVEGVGERLRRQKLVPQKLEVETDISDRQGTYLLSQETHAEYPVWESGTKRLFTTDQQQLMFGEKDKMDQNMGYIHSAVDDHSLLLAPQRVQIWKHVVSYGNWVDCTQGSIRVTCVD